MISYTRANDDRDLMGIISLQRQNLPQSLDAEEMQSQGFVTVVHEMEVLKKMNAVEKSVIARDKETVIAYLLAMTTASRYDLPVLVPMFDVFEDILFRGKVLSSYNYIVVGQVCVDKRYRGQGVLDECYSFYVSCFKEKYDFAVTEIATSNVRSIRAHRRIGFETIHEYTAPDHEKWSIVVLDWKDL